MLEKMRSVWVIFKITLRYTSNTSEALTLKAWSVQKNGLEIIVRKFLKGIYLEEYVAVHTIVCSPKWAHFVRACD